MPSKRVIGLYLDTAGVQHYLGVSRWVAEKIVRQLPKTRFPGVDKVYILKSDLDEFRRRGEVAA